MEFLRVIDLTLSLNGNPILDHLNIDFWKGHIHAIVGPNGAGKSTLAYTIMGLDGYQNIQGSILFKGRSINGLSIDERARMGMTLAWQEPARYEGLAVQHFIRASAKDKSDHAINDVLEKVGLTPKDYLHRAVDKSLSGGERKKIELASTLAMKPELILFDEPDSGIDVSSLRKIFNIIHTLKAMGTTVILITHSLDVLKQADHAFLICHGQLIDKGDIEKISRYFEEECMSCDHKNVPDPKENP
ncbi:ABC transporter ATP-binding protein [bacterium]|nr:ABC transporter ATP-binding protein [bacterium]